MKTLSYQHVTAKNFAKDQSKSIAVFGFEPGKKQSPEFGCLYVFTEFSNLDNHKHLLGKVEEIAGKTFFEAGITVSAEKRFSQLLKNYNTLVDEIAATKTDMIVLAVHNNKLLYSFIGQPIGILKHHSKTINLVEASAEPIKHFSEITETNLHNEDRIIIGSHSLNIQLTSQELSNLITDTSLETFSNTINSKLPQNFKSEFAAIFIESFEKRSLIKTPKLSLKPPNLGKSFKKKGKDVITAVNKSTEITKDKVVPNVSKKTKQGWTHLWSRYINPYPKRAIIVLAALLVGVIAIIILASVLIQNSSGILARYEQAQSLTSQAQVELQKQNTSSAKANAEKALAILNSLSSEDKKTINQASASNKNVTSFDELAAKLTLVLDELTNTTRVSLDQSYSLNGLNLVSLVMINGALFGVDTKAGQIVNINPLRKSPSKIAQSNNLTSTVSATESYSNDSGFVLTKDKLWSFNPSGNLQELKVSSLPPSVAIASYLNNIYLLSPTENQVIRYTKSANTLSAKTNLLKSLSGGSLSSATSVAVLGNIFISSGKNILLYEAGSQRDFKINNLPEDFGNIAQIAYNDSSQYFVVLNQARTRLALLNSGSDAAEFKRQYAFGQNVTIHSYTLAKDSKEMYVNADNKLVNVSLDQ